MYIDIFFVYHIQGHEFKMKGEISFNREGSIISTNMELAKSASYTYIKHSANRKLTFVFRV